MFTGYYEIPHVQFQLNNNQNHSERLDCQQTYKVHLTKKDDCS